LEQWETSELNELITRLEDKRLESPYQEHSHEGSIRINGEGVHDHALIKRLHEVEMRMADLRGENDKLKQDLEYFKSEINLPGNSSSHEVFTGGTTFTSPQCKPVESISIPPLDISESLGNLPSKKGAISTIHCSPSSSQGGPESNRQDDDEGVPRASRRLTWIAGDESIVAKGNPAVKWLPSSQPVFIYEIGIIDMARKSAKRVNTWVMVNCTFV
uniref:Transposase_23 domain-containing protein n=1 Tax=Angiostrongylus cantonensis TaxID=6313 RepID=A0A0K0CZD8_ANGCA